MPTLPTKVRCRRFCYALFRALSLSATDLRADTFDDMKTPPSTPTVLVIDDDPAIRMLFAVALELGGYAPIEAANAEMALRLIDRGVQPDAVLLDIEMPGMGGMGFLLQVRAHPRRRQIPVAIVTGSLAVPEPLRHAAHVFGVPVYHKPMLPEQLLEITGQLVAGNVQ